jgi:hypothetical protein
MRVQQVRLEPIRQRIKRFALSTFTGRFVKRQRVYRVTLGTKHFKRIVFAGSERPIRIAKALGALEDTGIFPRLYARYDEELWVGYLEGTPVHRDDTDVINDFAELIAVLYKADARETATRETNFRSESHADLELLCDAKVLDAETTAGCLDLFTRFTPERIWLGYDYGDALLKNLLRCEDGKIRFIDVESIRSNAVLGTGIAKALIRWVGDDRERLLDRLEALGAAPFRAYLPAVELSFLAAWTKRSLLQRKDTLIRPEPFRELLARTNRNAA